MNTPAHTQTSIARPLGAILLLLSLFAAPSAFAAAYTWSGGTSTDWNTPANWSGTPAAGWNPTVNLIPANICTITANPTYNPGDVLVGSVASTTGRVDHRAGTLTQNVIGTTGNWFFIGSVTGVGTYNLADTSVTGQANLTTFGQGSGSLTIGKLWVGGRDNSAGTGTFNLNSSGTISAQSTASGNAASVIVGSFGGTGTLNMDSGTINASGNLWIGAAGSGAATTGTVNMSGGTINAATILMCTNNGSGTATANLNITNATVNASGRTLVTYGNANTKVVQGTVNVGNGGTLNSENDLQITFAGSASGTGVVNIATGGIVNVATTTTRWCILNVFDPVNANLNVNGGTLNLNANTSIQFDTGNNATGNAVLTLNSGAISMWSGNKTGAGSTGVIDLNHAGTSLVNHTVNLNGGTLTIGAVVSTSTTGTRVFNFNGGTLKPTAASTSFFASGRASTAAVLSGGGTVDNNGFGITIGQVLSGTGAMTFTDSGAAATTILSSANTYTGGTTVSGGTLQLNAANSSSASVTVTNGATLALNIADALGFTSGKNVPTIYSGSAVSNMTAASRVTLWNGVTMTGGTLTGTSTGDASGAYSLSGPVVATSDASGNAATIGGSGSISLQNQNVANGAVTFNVTRGSATPASDLTVSANLIAYSTIANVGLNKTGNGILTLSGANTYTANTTNSAGTLRLANGGSIASTNVIISSGATFDVSAISYTMAANQSLLGSGVITGAVTTANSSSAIKPASVGVAGTLSFSNSLTMTSGGSAYFDLSTSASSGNDQIIVAGNLALNSSDTIHISALSGAANLDQTADYVLFSVGGTTTMTSAPVLAWDGTTPANYLNYSIQQVGQNVVLHYVAATAPTLTATAAPATAVRSQAVTITATVTPGNSSGNPVAVTNVQINATAIGGSSTATLVLSDTPNVYTNTFIVASSTVTGVKLMPVVATDMTPLSSPAYYVTNTIVATNEVWNGAGSDNKWSTSPNWNTGTPGTSGDSVTFAGSTQLTPNMDASYSVTGVTFDSTAGSFTLGTANSSTLTVAGGVTNNSANPQTLNMPITMSGAATLNATNGNLTLGQTLASGGNTLTVAGPANTTIGNVVSGGGSLFKQGTGTLMVSSNSAWGGTGASSGGFSGPLISQAGILLFNNGSSNNVAGELVIGGVVANGGPGQNANVTVDNSTLNVSGFLSVGRGNGVGGVSSDLVASNAAAISVANFSAGYNGGNATNFPKGSISLNGTATFTVTGNGVFYVGESTGSAMTVTLSNTASLVAAGTGAHRVGGGGGGVLNVNDSSTVNFGGGLDVGYVTGSGTVNLNSGFISTTGSGVTAIARSTAAGNTESGTFNLNGGTFNSAGDLVVGLGGTSNGVMNLNGGTVNVGTTATRALHIGQYDSVTGLLSITNGSLNLYSNSFIRFTANGGSGTNAVNQYGGTVTFYSDSGVTPGGTGWLDLAVAGTSATRNTYNLNGGTLTVPQIISSSATPTRIFNFNGGTLKAAIATNSFMNLGTGNAIANVRNGGAIVDNNGFNITIGQALLHSTIAGDNVVDGGLTKNGTGTLTLTNANTYTGNTTISAGTLALIGSGSIANSANISIASGTKFDVSGLSSTFGLGSGQTLIGSGGTIAGSVNLNAGSLALNYTNGTPALNVTNGTLNFNGNAVTVTVSGSALTAGSYKLVAKTTGGVVNGTLPASVTVNGAGTTAAASLQIVSGELYLMVGATSTALASSANPSGFKDGVTFTATVQTNGVTAGNATGTVTFFTNSVAFMANGLAGGTTNFNLSVLPRGTNLVTAIYSGDVNYLPSTNTLNQIVTNHPPVAGNMVVMRNAGIYGLRIAISDLLTNVTDTDSDLITLVGTGTSTNGVTVSTTGTNYLNYYNTNNVSDLFSYTVTDGFGGTNSGLVSIVVSNAVTGQITGQFTSFTNNVANLEFHGIPNYSYLTERSTNLADWVDISTNTAATNGVINVSDSFGDLGNVPPASAYYRLKWQP